MDAVVRTSIDRGEIELRDVPEPTVERDDDVLVRVANAGLCGSDVGAYLGHPEYDDFMPIPSVLGHEFAGVVEAVGDAVDHVAPGDRVVVWPGNPCGRCYQCRMGQTNVCPNREGGMSETGGFAPLAIGRADSIYPVPEGVPFRHAALTEPLGVTYRAVTANGEVESGETVLIQGPGPMGALSACLARNAGADVVISGLDQDAPRLEHLADVGFETVSVSDTSAAELVETYTRTDGFDAVVDATGTAAGVEASVEATRQGGRVVSVGIPSGDLTLDGTDLVRSEIHLKTSYSSTDRDLRRVLDLLEQGALPLDDVIDTGHSLTDPVAAFEAFAAGKTVKPVFDVSELAD